MKMIYQTALLIKTHLPSAKYKLFLSSLDEEEKLLLDACFDQGCDSDLELAPAIFGIKSNSVKYKRIKNNLQEKIYEFTLFAKPTANVFQEQYDVYDELFNAELLYKKYNYLFQRADLYLPIIKKHFSIAYKYYQNSMILSMSNNLIIHYGTREYDEKKLAYYQQIKEETIEIFYIEQKSRFYFLLIDAQFGRSQVVDRTKMTAEIKDYLASLSPYEGKIRSHIFHLSYYGLHMIYYHIQHDYEAVVALCDKALAYLNALPFKSIGNFSLIYKRKVIHLIWLKKYSEAKSTLIEVTKIDVLGGTGWFNSQYMFILIHLYKKEYAEAITLVDELHKNKIFTAGTSLYKSYIGLLCVYLNLFKQLGAIPEATSKNNYDVKKYLSDYNKFSKDKSGMNVPIIIAQLIEAIVSRKEDYIIDRQEALKKYTTRYIRQDDNIRSNCFIHMLLAVVKHNYHVVAIERHTQKYRDKLRDNPKINSEVASEIELVPYEDIWDILMEYLRNRRKG